MKKALHEIMTAYMHKNSFYPSDNKPHLLCVSGGLDSVSMVHLYAAAGLPFGIAHCNFQLRDAESDGDAAFVEALAESLHVPFHIAHFDTEKEAEKPGQSIQMAARALRYDFFEKIRKEEGYTYIATAHHRDDTIETALFNFGRGSSLKGMRGIPVQNGSIIRPLLGFGRSEIEDYAEENSIAWREDSSNKKDDYARNFIRHQIVPKFKNLNPNFSETAGKTIERIEAANANLEAFSRLFLEKELKNSPKSTNSENANAQILPFSALIKFPYPTEILLFWLSPFGFNREQCRQLTEHMESGQSGLQLNGNDNWKVTRRRDDFLLENEEKSAAFELKIQEDDMMLRLSEGGLFFMIKSDKNAPYPDGKIEILVDKKALNFPLTLRNWKAGDTFQPFGMEGKHQKVQDFLTNQKVPLNEKSDVLVLENGDGKILWLVGYRMADWVRVGADTEVCMKFRIQ